MRRRFRIVRLVSKPRETYRYTSTYCVLVIPSRLGAKKEHFFVANGLAANGPTRGDVSAVQIHLPYSFGTGDPYLLQSAVSFEDDCDAWNFKSMRFCKTARRRMPDCKPATS